MKVQLTHTEVVAVQCTQVYFFAWYAARLYQYTKTLGAILLPNVFSFICLRAKKSHLNIHPLSKEGIAILLYGHREFQVQCVIIICGALFNLRTDVEMIGSPIAINFHNVHVRVK